MSQEHYVGTQVRCLYEDGLKEDGSPIMKSKTFQQVGENVTAAQIQESVTGLFSLTQKEVSVLEKTVTFEIA